MFIFKFDAAIAGVTVTDAGAPVGPRIVDGVVTDGVAGIAYSSIIYCKAFLTGSSAFTSTGISPNLD
jgi:hypothetical protein